MKSLGTLAAVLALTGCACDRHPVACWAGAVIVAGSVAACSNHRSPERIDPSICGANRERCR